MSSGERTEKMGVYRAEGKRRGSRFTTQQIVDPLTWEIQGSPQPPKCHRTAMKTLFCHLGRESGTLLPSRWLTQWVHLIGNNSPIISQVFDHKLR